MNGKEENKVEDNSKEDMLEEYPEVVGAIYNALKRVDSDVARRNTYIDERDRKIYETGLFDGLEFPNLADKTLYNYLRRAVDIQVSQLMGRTFNVYSNYNKEDESALAEMAQQTAPQPAPQPAPETMPPEMAAMGQDMAGMGGMPPEAGMAPEQGQEPNPESQTKLLDAKNKLKQSNADTRKKLIDAIIRDNGGDDLFKRGARVGSAYGTTVYKMWLDEDEKRIKVSLLETPQNYYAGWSDSDFRERDWDAYVYQISQTSAYSKYGKQLGEGQEFAVTQDGMPFTSFVSTDQNLLVNDNTTQDTRTQNPMVTVVDFVGILPGWSLINGKFEEVKRGQEKPFCAYIVGKKIVRMYSEDRYLPRYYVIRNIEEPRRAWGRSDVNDAMIQVNQTMIQVMSTWTTLFEKEVSPVYMAKGFEGQQIPKRERLRPTFIPMAPEQDIQLLSPSTAFTGESQTLISELKDAFMRVSGIPRVMFDDSTINPVSNQALMTTMKGLIDIVEDKQARWTPVLIDMFTEALNLATYIAPEIKQAVKEDDWFLKVEWPSVLRREDATYQQMWLNLFNAGVISLETYYEKLGFNDTTEEIDRLRDELKDKTTAAVLGRQIGALAQQVIAPPQGGPQPDVKINLRGDLTPNQEANLASQQGFNEGPFPPSSGPQGQTGLKAQENVDNQGYIAGGNQMGGEAIQYGPDGQPLPPVQDQANPQLTVDQNTGQTASQPGSGAPAVSPQGAINQMNQREGK